MRHGKSRTVNDKCSHHFPVLGWWVQSDCLMWGTPETDCVDLSFVTPTWIMEASESLTGFYSRLFVSRKHRQLFTVSCPPLRGSLHAEWGCPPFGANSVWQLFRCSCSRFGGLRLSVRTRQELPYASVSCISLHFSRFGHCRNCLHVCFFQLKHLRSRASSGGRLAPRKGRMTCMQQPSREGLCAGEACV